MMQIVLIGLGAGAASALLFASITSGSPLSLMLANFAQLPILIAAIGWTHLAGLIARADRVRGSCASFSAASVGFAFLIGIGLPAWWIGYLALLARPAPGAAHRTMEWYPVGRIVVWTAIAAGAIVIVSMLRYGLDADEHAGRAAARAGACRARFFAALRDVRCASEQDPERLNDVLVLVVPRMKAIALTVDEPAQSLARGADREDLRAAAAAVAADRADVVSAIRPDRARRRGRGDVPAGAARPDRRRVHREPAARLCAARLRGGACRHARRHRARLHAHRPLSHRRAVQLAAAAADGRCSA